MFQCGLAEVKNNYMYLNKSSHAKTYGMSISKTSTLYICIFQLLKKENKQANHENQANRNYLDFGLEINLF